MDGQRLTRRSLRSQPARKIFNPSALEMTAALFGVDQLFASAVWASRFRPYAVRRMKRRYLALANQLLDELKRAQRIAA